MSIQIGSKNFNFPMNQESFKDQKTRGKAGDDIFVACVYDKGIYYFGRGWADKSNIRQLNGIKKKYSQFNYVNIKAEERIIPKIEELEIKMLAIKLAIV